MGYEDETAEKDDLRLNDIIKKHRKCNFCGHSESNHNKEGSCQTCTYSGKLCSEFEPKD